MKRRPIPGELRWAWEYGDGVFGEAAVHEKGDFIKWSREEGRPVLVRVVKESELRRWIRENVE
jgi:hypothetical protein